MDIKEPTRENVALKLKGKYGLEKASLNYYNCRFVQFPVKM